MNCAVYILANKKYGTLYTGVTSDLIKRVYEHKNNSYPGSFASKYNIHNLVWYEVTESIESAILREKQLKAGNRKSKIELVDNFNPSWKDLYPELV
jgi:putative endonuclease